MERFVVRLLGMAEICKDAAIRDELMRAANDLIDIIEKSPRVDHSTRDQTPLN
jgi:hypothetical protein